MLKFNLDFTDMITDVRLLEITNMKGSKKTPTRLTTGTV